MFNMIRLDWLGMKYYWPRVLLYIVFVCLLGLLDPIFVIPAMLLQMLYFSYYPFMAEEKGQLAYLYFTLPVSRKDAVRARFGLAFVMQAAGILTGIVVTLGVAGVLKGKSLFSAVLPVTLSSYQPDLGSMILLICGSLASCAFFTLFMYPVLFWLGYAKGKVWGFYIPVALMSVIAACIGGIYGMALQSGTQTNKALLFLQSVSQGGWPVSSLLLLCGAAALWAASYGLSQIIYARREL